MKRSDYCLYFATDSGMLKGRDLCDIIAEAIAGGVTMVQLREKALSSRCFFELGEQVRNITATYRVPLIINDRIDLMLALGADGVHIGKDDLPLPAARQIAGDGIVGYSVDTLEDLRYAEESGADYVGIGPVYATSTKTDAGAVLGVDGLRQIVAQARVPCVAIGGIKEENCAEVAGTGVSGVCVISTLMNAVDTEKTASVMRQRLQTAGLP